MARTGKRKRLEKRRSEHIPPELTDAARGLRLQKFLAEAGVASRRECEQMILDGRVRVNGSPVTAMPAWVDPHRDRVEVDGQLVARPRKKAVSYDHVYVMLHKPRNVISTVRDPEGRRHVLDLVQLPPGLARRVYPVGRLDADSTGLMLLTNDGPLANRLTHPRYGVAKQYRVAVRGLLTVTDIERLKSGLYLGPHSRSDTAVAKRARVSQVRILGHQRDQTRGDRTLLLVTLKEGQNREIRRLLARLGYNVRRLQRVAIGPLQLKGLASGQWRLLTRVELAALRKSAGLTHP